MHKGQSVNATSGGSRGMRGMRPHPPQLGQKIFQRLYFGHCGETADQIWMPFGVIGRTGPGMRQVVGFWDRSTGRGTFGRFGGEFRARHCNQWGLYGVRVHFRSDAALREVAPWINYKKSGHYSQI